jgi:CheY-like chemotaxis protein/HPt (histidine-containing phosphotransfer) domain-containing protein
MRGEETPDGPTAIEALCRAHDAGDPFRIAILDMQMPGMDGAELAMAIKANEKIKDTRLVLMTSLGHRGDAKKMEQIGFSAYLQKPARHSELSGCLSAVLTSTATQLAQPIVRRHAIREMRHAVVRILLAEDNITNQQVAVGILKKLGLRADAEANGAEAVHALETLPYDLVLMDVQMPVMDGLRATLEIRNPRSAVRNHEIPIIAMTAHAMQGDREKCLKAGMNDYVSKPVNPKALADALDKWLPRAGKDEYPISNVQYPMTKESLDIEHSQLPIFDKAGLLDRVMEDEDLARQLIDVFLDDIPKQIESLRGYLASGDVSGTERQAHTIKGASANLGGEKVRALAFEMEKSAKAGDLEYVKSNLNALEKQFTLLKQEMKN